MTPLRLGSRKSPLAKAQATWVALRLQSAFPDLAIELIYITTTGDVQSQGSPAPEPAPAAPDTEGGLKALFTKEIEEALLDNQIDLAVHSLKDMAADILPGLALAAVPVREDPRDVWIGKNGMKFMDIPQGGSIATGAVRRQAQLRHVRPDLKLFPLRGNVDTRLRKLQEGACDGMVLALAGLKRLGRELEATDIFSIETMLPAIGQGALGIEARIGDSKVEPYIKSLDDAPSHDAALAERQFLKTLGGSCQTPIAAYAQVASGRISLSGLVVGLSGMPYLKETTEGPVSEAESIGQRLAEALLQRGADKVLS